MSHSIRTRQPTHRPADLVQAIPRPTLVQVTPTRRLVVISDRARTGPSLALAHSGRIHKASGSGICPSSLPPASPEDRGAYRASAHLGSPRCDDEGHEPEDEGNRRHHHRAKPHAGAEHRGILDRLTGLALLLCKFDDQNAVLRGERDQDNEAYLGIQIEIEPCGPDSGAQVEQMNEAPVTNALA